MSNICPNCGEQMTCVYRTPYSPLKCKNGHLRKSTFGNGEANNKAEKLYKQAKEEANMSGKYEKVKKLVPYDSINSELSTMEGIHFLMNQDCLNDEERKRIALWVHSVFCSEVKG